MFAVYLDTIDGSPISPSGLFCLLIRDERDFGIMQNGSILKTANGLPMNTARLLSENLRQIA